MVDEPFDDEAGDQGEEPLDVLMGRVGQGDEAAAAVFFQTYFPHLLRIVRHNLHDPKLRRQVDSLDVCQSVLLGLFKGIRTGQIQLAEPAQLHALLSAMVENKVLKHARRLYASRRTARRLANRSVENLPLASAAPDPADDAAQRELIAMFYARLSADELAIFELRQAGRTWSEIAATLGGQPNALRMSQARFLARLDSELDLGLSRESRQEEQRAERNARN